MERGLIRFFGKQFESNGENAKYGKQPEILAPVYVLKRRITVHYEDSDKGNVFGDFFTDRPGIDILYYAAGHYYLLTNWLAYLYGRIQSPRPDVMPDRREGITRAAGFVFACIDTQTS